MLKKKIFYFGLMISMLVALILPTSICADESDVLIIDGNRVEKIYFIEGGNAREISVSEYNSIPKAELIYEDNFIDISSEEKESEIQPKGMTDDWHRYDESGSGTQLITSERKRVSTIVYNGTSSMSSRTLSYSSSSNSSFSTSLTSSERNAVIGGVSFTWNFSSSVSDSNTINLKPNEYGWFEFAPIKNKSWGYLKTFDWLGNLKKQKYVVAYSPNKVSGQLDGILYKMTSYSQPN